MPILIFGTGAVGAYLGARLMQSGQEVMFLARPAWAQAIRTDGIRIEGTGASETLHPAQVLTDLPTGFQLDTGGAILLTVKAYDCEQAAAAIRDRIAGAPPVVCLLNGIGNEETLERILGEGRVTGATLTTAVSTPAPGVIRIERERGAAFEHTPTGLQVQDAFRRAGLPTRIFDVRGSIKWSKLPTNMIANATSAILGWTAGQAMSDPGIFRIEVEAIREAMRVLRRLGHRPVNLPGVPVAWLAWGIFLPPWISQPWLSRVVARGRGAKRPSFHFDIGRGRSEAPWIHGPILDHGRDLGVPTPANEVLLETLMLLVEGRVDPTEWRDRPSALIEQARRRGVPRTPRSDTRPTV